jgi:hypothetical protein
MPPPSTLRIFYKDRSSGLALGILVEAEPTIMRGPPKRKDRKVIGALIGAVTGFVPLLIAFVFFPRFSWRITGRKRSTASRRRKLRRNGQGAMSFVLRVVVVVDFDCIPS